MPLIGFVDPRHDEKKADRPGRKPAWLPLDKLLSEAATWDPKISAWPYELIKAVLDQHQERDYISTSMVTGGCARSRILERKEPYVDRLEDRWAAMRGTAGHYALERAARPGSAAEARFFSRVYLDGYGDVEVSCTPDILTEDGQLGDWKFTDNPPMYYPWVSHKEQVNMNRYIVNHAYNWESDNPVTFNPILVEYKHLFLTYLGPKGPKTLECEKTQDTISPNGAKIRLSLPYVMSDEEVEGWMLPRIQALQTALDSYPKWDDSLTDAPGFEGEPGWKCPGKPWCSLPSCLAKRYPRGLVW
jgi:hypothetical protein